MASVPDRPDWWRRQRNRLRSLEWRLPLLISGMLVVLFGAAIVLSQMTLRDAARDMATARLERAASQLAALATTSMAQVKARHARAADDAALERALQFAGSGSDGSASLARDTAAAAAAREVLEALLPDAASDLSIELWTEDGRRIAFAGADRLTAGSVAGSPEPGGFRLPRRGLDGIQPADSVILGDLYLVDGLVHFLVVAPVSDGGRRLGYLTREIVMRDGPRAEQTIRGLTGEDVDSYYRNRDGDVWLRFSGDPVAPPAVLDSGDGATIVSRGGQPHRLAVAAPVAGSPLVIVLESPLASAFAEANETMRRLLLIGVALLLAGVLASWRISRRVTRPVGALTLATESMARGDFSTRVRPAGDDELRRLASGFNHMAAEIGAVHEELEMQTEEAQATAEELEMANHELTEVLASAEEREQQFRALANAIPQLAWMAHADGSIFWYNDRWYEYTGATPESMAGWGWQSVHDPGMLPRVLDRWRASLAAGSPFEMEFPLRGADGRYRWFLTRVHPLRDRAGKVVRWFGTNTDIDALREARAAAESASRAKSEFLAVMSHELRTPLNAIAGYTELMEMELRGPLTPEQRRDLVRIRESQRHLLGLISAMLDLSRIEAGRVTYRLAPIDAGAALDEIVALMEPQALAKQVTLAATTRDGALAVRADPEKLRQILFNLLSNAIRHTEPGGTVTLVAQSLDDRVAVSVQDTGEGIAAESLELIFEPFVQLDRSLSRSREGIGLGLAISRDLARGMGGDLTATSRLGRGSTFTLVLPQASAVETAVG